MSVVVVVALGLSAAALPVAGYLGFLALLAWPPRKTPERRDPDGHFTFLVPAHNEEEGIGNTVASLESVDWPEALRSVVVIADNCSDATAERARAAGATVLERQHETERGKGYALEYAFAELTSEAAPEPIRSTRAFIVVDADTEVSSNLVHAFARCLENERAAQTEYGVSNPDASWRTRLMVIALAMFHRCRMLARERLGLSVGLRGNGMCFERELVREVPHTAHGLAEDVQYGIELGLKGHRVAYAWEAEVRGEMVTSGKAAVSQRRRWEGGRLELLARYLPPLLAKAWRSPMALDLTLDLVIPPLSYVGLLCMGAATTAAAGWALADDPTALVPSLAACVALALYVLRGAQLSSFGFLRSLRILSYAPVYVLWKLVATKPWKRPTSWVRTDRERKDNP